MKDTQQLIKKGNEGIYEDIFPNTYTDAVFDRKSGENLDNILSGFNMYFLPYTGSKRTTRLQVPMSLRRQGLWITYVTYDKVVIVEWYDSDLINDENWELDINWEEGSIKDIWKNYRGYTPERPNLTTLDDGYPFFDRNLKKYICWSGEEWVNFDGSPLS